MRAKAAMVLTCQGSTGPSTSNEVQCSRGCLRHKVYVVGVLGIVGANPNQGATGGDFSGPTGGNFLGEEGGDVMGTDWGSLNLVTRTSAIEAITTITFNEVSATGRVMGLIFGVRDNSSRAGGSGLALRGSTRPAGVIDYGDSSY
jgi:hypothetical protein